MAAYPASLIASAETSRRSLRLLQTDNVILRFIKPPKQDWEAAIHAIHLEVSDPHHANPSGELQRSATDQVQSEIRNGGADGSFARPSEALENSCLAAADIAFPSTNGWNTPHVGYSREESLSDTF
jgi:hypothetical protein